MLPDDDKRYAIETCRNSDRVLKKWFKINDIQFVHLLVVWWLVKSQDLITGFYRTIHRILWIKITRFFGTLEGVKQLSCCYSIWKSTKCKEGNCAALLELITRLGLCCAPCFNENERREIYLLKRTWSTWINGYVTSIWKCVSNKNYIYSALGISQPEA